MGRPAVNAEEDDPMDIPEDHISFVDCTCDHERDEHGWMCCGAQDENGEDCPCDGHFEE
jgi:hypothetical protein